jgi:regulator of protease activity HflC (stomatin/prohibitin superfamily)
MIIKWYQARQVEVVVMTTQASAPSQQAAARQWTERELKSTPGIPVLVISVAAILAGIAVIVLVTHVSHTTRLIVVWAAVLVFIVASSALKGLTSVIAGEARPIQLFGNYHGTIRAPGLHCVNPFTDRRKVSVRVRNLETALLKVNDADGNPIEIAAVVVWQVLDTAKAIYGVDDFARFVAIQCETAVRHIASSYAYDTRGSGQMSLRDNADEITARLSAEIADRVKPAGVQIIESRLTRLSYAPEIAQAMLRQQQANAVVGARSRIVEGAVGMVQLALQRLEEEGVVQLDEERKAAMVSNLLVVLCSEQATQQVVNTGSLYQ